MEGRHPSEAALLIELPVAHEVVGVHRHERRTGILRGNEEPFHQRAADPSTSVSRVDYEHLYRRVGLWSIQLELEFGEREAPDECEESRVRLPAFEERLQQCRDLAERLRLRHGHFRVVVDPAEQEADNTLGRGCYLRPVGGAQGVFHVSFHARELELSGVDDRARGPRIPGQARARWDVAWPVTPEGDVGSVSGP